MLVPALVVATAALAAGPVRAQVPAPGSSATFTNPGSIVVADGCCSLPPFTPGLGAPYPSTIGVSGLSGPVSRVTVTLNAINHGKPDDLDVMLVGPSGQKVVLLSDAGGEPSFGVVNLTLTFADAAPTSAPDTTDLVGPGYKPTDRFGGFGEDVALTEFPPPAPAKPGVDVASLPLSTFNGSDPNGVWRLYVTDDAPGGIGQIAGGWTLDITTSALPVVDPPPPPSPKPPAPVLGKAVVAKALKGTVFVSVPRSAAGARASQTAPGLKGRKFVPLSSTRQIPTGSFLDTRKGTVRLTSERSRRGRRQTGDFSSGVFQVLQSRKRRAKGLVDLKLKGSFARCRRGKGSQLAQVARHGKKVTSLRSKTRGKHRTRGRNGSGNSRATEWVTTDHCDGTLFRVKRGKVAVRDFRRKRTILVRAGKSYFARARR